MSELYLVPAGAGAGKTHKIKTELTKWVKDGSVRPERILAVTFTEAAAGELKGRIRSSLLDEGLLNEALAVDSAYISTIHSLGLRLLTEHAFANGSSPMPRLLSDAERDLLLRVEISRSDALKVIASDLTRHGYAANFVSGATAEDGFRKQVFATINHLRSLGFRGTAHELSDHAIDAIKATYKDPVGDPKTLGDALHDAVSALLKEFPSHVAECAESRSAKMKFRDDFRILRTAKTRRELDRNWNLWQKLRDLRLSKRGAATPPGYDALAQNVIDAAAAIVQHPGPLADACEHARALIAGGQEILERYALKKREMGVIDYTDMIVDAEQLIRSDSSVAAAILAEIDCVIIDEFQDTNPIQFSFLWQLANKAPKTLIVGDVKQAIMGFQGADSRLMESLVDRNPANVSPLEKNWRSDARIMNFINALGPQLFGPNYLTLKPHRHSGTESAIEVLDLQTAGGGKKKLAKPEAYVAARIFNLLEYTKAWVPNSTDTGHRLLQPRDIAVLCPTHAMARAYAASLRSLGLPVQINAEGWLQSPTIQTTLNALALAADSSDRHAALAYAVQGPPRMSLEKALIDLADDTLMANPAFAAFADLQKQSQTLTVPSLLDATISKLDLRSFADRQDDPRQSRADLLRLEYEAQAFLETHRDMTAAAGFYGQNAKVFIGWLEYRLAERDFNRQPNPGANAAGGIEIVTWHASKGREWPVVAVVGLETGFDPSSLVLTTHFSSFENPDSVLNDAQLRFCPHFAAKEQMEAFKAELMDETRANAKRLIYVALTRPRDKLIIAWPSYQVNKKRKPEDIAKTYARLLKENCSMAMVSGGMEIGASEFSARIIHCDGEHPPEMEMAADRPPIDTSYQYGRAAIIPEAMREPGAPWIIRPSKKDAHSGAVSGTLLQVPVGNAIVMDGTDYTNAADRGTSLHEAMRFMMQSPELKDRIGAFARLDTATMDRIEIQASALGRYLTERGYHTINHEVPFNVINEAGSRYNAIIDLLAENDDCLSIVDHKSDRVEDIEERFAEYWPQLMAYVDVMKLARPDKPVGMVAIHWLAKGLVTEVKL